MKYHGLINQGATCYLNSVLQVLFMTEDFREAVERDTSETPGPIDHHLKQLFEDLKKDTANTFNITETLGIDSRVGVYKQRDAAEYFEKVLSLTGPEASQIFGGLLTHKNTCSRCRTEKDNDERFWHLTLALVDFFDKENYSVVDGIEEYFRPYVFSGENQMYCDKCDTKSDATNKCVIKNHPEVLMLLLKRFEFDYHYMTYVKINCTVDVPDTLQIPENKRYELYAVVDHFGDLRSGHYTATIKDDESWYRFNDDKVTLLNYQPFQEKSSTAYLLFYRKTNDTQDIREKSTPARFLPATSDIYEQHQDAGEIREREEVEGAAKAGDDKQRDEGEIMKDDEEHIAGKAEAAKTEPLSRDAQVKESVEDQENEGSVDVSQDISEDVGGTMRSSKRNKIRKQQTNEKMDVKRVKEQKAGDDNCHNVEDENNEGLDDIGQNQSEQTTTDIHARNKDVCAVKQAKETENKSDEKIQNRVDSPVRRTGSSGSKRLTENHEVSSAEKTKHGHSPPRAVGRSPEPCFNVEDQDKQVYTRESKPINHQECNENRNSFYHLQDAQAVKHRDGGKIMTDDDEDMGRKAEVGKTEPLSRDAQVEESVEDQENEGSVDVSQDISEDVGGTMRSSNRNKIRKQQTNEKMDVKRVKEQKAGDDNCHNVEDENNEGLDDIGQNQSEQTTTDIHARNKDVCAVKQAKEPENKSDEKIQNREDSPGRRTGSSGSKRLTENHEVSSAKKTRDGDPPPKASNVFNENTMKIRHDPEQSGPGGNVKRKSDPKINAEVSLSESDCNMKLCEATSQEPQKRTTKRSTGNTQEETEKKKKERKEKKRKKKERKERKMKRKEKSNHKQTFGCLPFFCKSKNNVD